jgi:hypothetical protein
VKKALTKKHRLVIALIVIMAVIGLSYEYYLPIYQQQQVQQNAIDLIKQYGLYNENYSYVVFGSLYLDQVLSSYRTTGTYTYGYQTGTTSSSYLTSTYLTSTTVTDTGYKQTPTGQFVYNSTAYETYTYSFSSSSSTQIFYHTTALVSYATDGGDLIFTGWSVPGCRRGGPCGVAIMLIDTQSTEQYPVVFNPRYEVVHLGFFYFAPLAVIANWRFYFVYIGAPAYCYTTRCAI